MIGLSYGLSLIQGIVTLTSPWRATDFIHGVLRGEVNSVVHGIHTPKHFV